MKPWKIMKINQILVKTYKTNQEKGQYRSVFELNTQENHRILSILWSFYLVFSILLYAMDLK